jgi:hypothetical protein
LLANLVGIVYKNVESRSAYVNMRLNFSSAIEQYDQLRLLYVMTLGSFAFFGVWELFDWIT